ncbi:uncharacterized protein LOC115455069 [Manduca sexta]|uniref:uncharacterized protein LOC115455069 n=1 Tax=Manduca sexta TaxID=7130 RepID=UPI00188F7DC4|nr:uncharacterized protein LOC115455069 [Manduca sexta]
MLCHRCHAECGDGVQCTSCRNYYDYPCAGITEAGYKKLGDRKATWKCGGCKAGAISPIQIKSNQSKTSTVDMETIHQELKKLTKQMSSLPQLVATVKTIQSDLEDLKTMKNEMSDFKESLNHVHVSIDDLVSRVAELDQEMQSLKNTRDDISRLERRMEKFEINMREMEQRSRSNNIEIKGVPVAASQNLYSIISKIGIVINCEISMSQINYIASVPQRGNKSNKNIIISLHNRYLRDEFISAAKRFKILTTKDLGLGGDGKIFINDHLTLENKQLLNKAKTLAKEKKFSYTWVKNCTIFVRKNITSPTFAIKTEKDLKKIF